MNSLEQIVSFQICFNLILGKSDRMNFPLWVGKEKNYVSKKWRRRKRHIWNLRCFFFFFYLIIYFLPGERKSLSHFSSHSGKRIKVILLDVVLCNAAPAVHCPIWHDTPTPASSTCRLILSPWTCVCVCLSVCVSRTGLKIKSLAPKVRLQMLTHGDLLINQEDEWSRPPPRRKGEGRCHMILSGNGGR